MTREEALKLLGGVLQGYLLEEDINQIYNDHEAQLKAKDEEIRRLNNLYADTIKELGKLKLELFRSSPKIANKKTRSIVAMLFWEYKKLRYTSDGYFHSDEEIENAYYTFKKAYKMLKDNK